MTDDAFTDGRSSADEPDVVRTAPSPTDGPRSGPRRWIRRLLWLLSFLELCWLVAGNGFLRTDWGPSVLGRRPERLQISWHSAWTPLPGVVRVHRIDVRGRKPKVTWMAAADRAWLWIAPLDLLRRRFHVRWLVADALESRVRMERKDFDGQPTIDGFEGLPEPVRRVKNHRWRLDFDRVSVDGIRELWFGPLHYVARPDSQDDAPLVGTASGRLRAEVRGEVSVPWAVVELGPGRAIAGSKVIGAVTRLAFDGELHPFVPLEVKGIATLGYVSGTLEAATTGGSLGLVDYFFRGAPASVRGTGRLDTTLHLERGILRPGSRLAVDDGSVVVSYLGWRGEGDGRLQGEVGAGGKTTLEVVLDEIDLGLDRVADRLVRSSDARLVATADRFDLTLRRPALNVRAELSDADVPDLARLQPFLPSHARVEILGGSGSLKARGELKTRAVEPAGDGSETAGAADPGLAGSVSGELQILGESVDVRVQGRTIEADVELDIAIPGGDLATRRLDVGGSRLQLRRVRMKAGGTPGNHAATAKDWWADLSVRRGSVQMPRHGSVIQSTVDAEIEAEVADSRPLLALVLERRPSFQWFERMLTFENLDLDGRLVTRKDGVELRDLRVHDRASPSVDKGLQILAQLRFDEGGYDALMRASMKAPIRHVAVGLRLRDGKIDDIDLRHSLDWYREQSGSFWAAASSGAGR